MAILATQQCVNSGMIFPVARVGSLITQQEKSMHSKESGVMALKVKGRNFGQKSSFVYESVGNFENFFFFCMI